MSTRNLRLAALIGVVLTVLHCSSSQPPPKISPDGPRLILLVVVDQFRYDYLDRFDAHFTGGLKWLHDRGVVFTNANYDHAGTVTTPGHATLASGLHPSHSGLIGNGWYDRQSRTEVYSLADREHGLSPINLLGTTLGDWLKSFDPESRVFSVSHKARSAIALGGHQADAAFWWSGDGGFESNSYYPKETPDWLPVFLDRKIPDSYFGQAWDPIELSPEEAESAQISEVDEGLFGKEPPYAMGGAGLSPGGSFYAAFRDTPFADDYMLELARTLVEKEQLGQRDHLDFLALSLSVLDSVGHTFGPNSREVADTLLRLDRSLQEFFDFLDRSIGLERVIVGFSTDHGVGEMPEYLQSKGLPGYRLGSPDILCIQNAGARVQQSFGLESWVLEGFYLDRDAIENAGVEPSAVEAALGREIETCDIVERVWTRTELQATRDDEPDRFRRLFYHSFHPEKSADLTLQLVENAIDTNTRATHGSPYAYDTHVPMILVVPGINAVEISEPARPVDLAPTLAGQAGIAYPADLDGNDLSTIVAEHAGGQHGRPAYGDPSE